MRRVATALVLMLGLSAPAAQDGPAAPTDASHFPLAVGNRWVYRVAGQEDRLTVTAAAAEKVGDTPCVRLEGRLQGRVIATEHLSVGRDAVLRHRNDGGDIEPPLPICRFPAEGGLTWQADYRFNDRRASIAYRTETEEVTVPAGTFQALVVHADATSRGGKTRTTVWYAPKVGMVKQVIEEGDRAITLVLERFDPATPKDPAPPKFQKKNPK